MAVLRKRCLSPLHAFSMILMVEQSGEMFLMSIPKPSPNPAAAKSANMIRYFSFLVLDKMPVTTSPEKVGHRCCFLELARVEEKLGRKPIMYSRQDFLEKLLRKDINELAPYALWVSHYTNA